LSRHPQRVSWPWAAPTWKKRNLQNFSAKT
jgi:hypothetical protein